ncbi:MAG: transposase [Acidobacteriia bacterium]|nr:transposase [Terriglobia bacterium]
MPKRKSLRLRGYNYAAPGGYFVTICTQGKRCVLGQIESGKMQLSPAGQAVQQAWFGLPRRFPSLYLDAFIVMPNHMHGILVFVGAGLAPPADVAAGVSVSAVTRIFHFGKIAIRENQSMRAFKSISTIAVNRVLQRRGVQLWQRNYYEHIVRNGDDLDNIRRYIFDNPLQWDLDPENPVRPTDS